MKVLIVNAADIEGGAARAANRLHHALLAEGVETQMLVQSKASDDFTVIGPGTKIQKGFGKIRPILDSLPVRRYKKRTKTLFSPAWVPFSGWWIVLMRCSRMWFICTGSREVFCG